jgi:hypothetical protein
MLDTPLVRGERGVFIPVVGGVRLDMALGRRKEGKNEYRWWALPCFFYLNWHVLTFWLAHARRPR